MRWSASTKGRAVVTGVDAGIVCRAIDRDSSGAANGEWLRDTCPGERRSHAKVARLCLSDGTNLSSDFGKILVQAEDNRDVKDAGKGAAQGVDCDSHVNAFFLLVTKCMSGTIGQGKRLRSITKRTTECHDSFLAHRPQLALPKGIPEGIIARTGNTGVEARFREPPVLHLADGLSQAQRVEIGVVIPEGSLRLVEEVLAVDVGDRPRGRNGCGGSVRSWRCGHKKRTHPGLAACRMGKKSKSSIGVGQLLLHDSNTTLQQISTRFPENSENSFRCPAHMFLFCEFGVSNV
jgi:hypothetical protein